MFVVENYFHARQMKIEAWQRARDKWLAKDEGYGYRTERDYERQHPYPVIRGKRVFSTLLPVLGVSVFAGALVLIIVNHNPVPTKTQHSTVQKKVEKKTGDSCGKFKMNDHVRIQYGDERGDTGTLIGGCDSNEAFQVKLDHDQEDGYGNNLGGQTISVNDDGNLVVVEK